MVRDLPDSAGGILSYFTRHKTLANLLLVVLLMAGAVALPTMRAQFFPDVVVDSINISVAWNGAGAEDAARTVGKIAYHQPPPLLSSRFNVSALISPLRNCFNKRSLGFAGIH